MKKIILTGLSLALGGVLFSSFENGVYTKGAGDCTGATGSTGTCSSSGCHFSSGLNDLNLSIIVTDASNGDVVNTYVPEGYYKVTLKGVHGAGGVFAGYGLQFTAANANDGQFTLIGNSLKSTVIPPYEYIEHSAPIPSVSNGEVYFLWKAPAAGTGNITFYCTMLAANGDHAITGDIDRNTSLTLQEGTTSVADLDAIVSTTLYPNPVKDYVTLMMETKESGAYSFNIYNLTGQKMLSEIINVQSGKVTKQFDATHLNAGMYFLEMKHEGRSKTLSFVKQ